MIVLLDEGYRIPILNSYILKSLCYRKQIILDAPRFRWLKDKQVAFEPGIAENVLRDLEARGHQILSGDRAAHISFGGGQVIVRDPDTGLLIGGSEPRKDGAALGY